MDHQASPQYQAEAPGSTQPMVYLSEKYNGGIEQPQADTDRRNVADNDFIERVNVQDVSRPTRHDPEMIDVGPEPTYVTPLDQLGETPAMIACPHCKHAAMTRVSKEDSSMTTICGVVLCLVCVCAACLPCMCGWFQDIDHYCTNCNHKVVHRRHDGGNEIIPTSTSAVPTPYPHAKTKQEATNYPIAVPKLAAQGSLTSYGRR